MTIKCLIIDDNPFIVDLLSDLLKQHRAIQLLGVARNGAEGLDKIRKLQPDMVFLDVEMPDMTGFEMLARLPDLNFQTIFITSFSHYAIQAIRFNALDYLVKPIDPAELDQAIRRYRRQAGRRESSDRVERALSNLGKENPEDQVLLLHTQEGSLQITLREIITVEGERNYSFLHLSGNRKKLSSKTLGYFEEILTDKGFFRCHRSYIVNGLHIKKIDRAGTFILQDGRVIPIARRKKSEANQWFGGLNV